MLNISMQPRLAQRQSIVITPQLQQAITLLQMSNVEICDHAEEVATENPFLHVVRPESRKALWDGARAAQSGADRSSKGGGGSNNDLDPMESLADTRDKSLYAHVFAQTELMFDTTDDKVIAYALCEAIEQTGWITENIAMIAFALGVSDEDVERVLSRLQTIEPAGLFARNLAECLRLQARDVGLLCNKMEALLKNLPLFAKGEIAALKRLTDCSAEEIGDLARKLRTFEPKPGLKFSGEFAQPVFEPDLIAYQDDNEDWIVELNRSNLPAIRVDTDYSQAVKKLDQDGSDENFIREAITSARWLKRAIAQRNETNQKVGAEIVRYQREFLEKGISYLRPLQLRTVADAIGVHESTVSRVTSSVMMATPQGTFPLKAFFSSALHSDSSEEGASAKAIRQRIRDIISQENPQKPISDEAISKIISKDGIRVARRTVAKYREIDGVPSSSQRRRRQKIEALCG